MKSSRFVLLILLAGLFGIGLGYVIFRPAEATQAVPGTETSEEEHAEDHVYTCSMHLQIRQDEPGNCPICGMELIPLSEAKNDDPLVLKMTPEAARLAQLETTVLGSKGQSGQALTLNGTIRPDERRVSSLVSHVPGRIEKLYVSFTGERVAKGQAIAELYAPKFVSAQQELLQALKFEDSNPRLLKAARGKMQNWHIPQSIIDEVERTGEIQRNIVVHAENSGIVQERIVAVGDHVMEGGIMFEVVDLGKLWVLLDAYEDDLSKVKIGDEVSFTTPALPGQTFETRVTYIDPVINPQTRVASLRAELSNPGGRLKPEMFVKATLRSEGSGDSELAVPKSAVLWTGKRSVVYVAVPNSPVPSYSYREVVLGESIGDSYLVQSGLQAGDRVVTQGAFAIDAAAQLNNQSSMINRLVSLKGSEAPGAFDLEGSAPESFRVQIDEVADAYLDIKDALIASKGKTAKDAAGTMLDKLDAVDMTLLKGEAHNFWMKQRDALRSHAGNISETEDVEAQRKQFEFLSQALIGAIRAFGSDSLLYVQHCPMAANDKGADWLSLESEIRNPYFGEAMLSCGSVTDSLGI